MDESTLENLLAWLGLVIDIPYWAAVWRQYRGAFNIQGSELIRGFTFFILAYFVLLNLCYLALNLMSLVTLYWRRHEQILDELPQVYTGLEQPITIVVPAYNEELTIASSIRSMLQLSYSEFEIVVVNDGSGDGTIDVLIREFALIPFPRAYPMRILTKPVLEVYQSTLQPNLRVVNKANGGKGDALNAGINVARYPLFCAVDADSVLQRDSLQLVVKPFRYGPDVIATGGTVRVANGCEVSGGFLTRVGLPSSPLALFQVVEYLRAFLFGRMGWSTINALLIVSGAFGVFRKDVVIEAGGYRTDTIGEDMELVVRLHRMMRERRRKYRIVFVPEPICWTEAPEDLKTLRNQRIRWQRGLSESLVSNWRLMFRLNGGAAGHLAFPFMLVFEWLGPLIELGGYVFMTLAFFSGYVSWYAFAVFLFVAVGLGILLSISGLLLEELAFHLYPKRRQLLVLGLFMILENIGYRQINSYWRLVGLCQWAAQKEAAWGEMKRKGVWQREI
jgi:cellulose synthase/poly-beta-1,6-N-acetylglucosamine synthase-like glycosyltransferase